MLNDIEKFEKWLIANDHVHNTIRQYKREVKVFLDEYDEITEQNIIEFLAELQSEKGKSTVNQYRCAIKAYLDFINLDVPVPDQLTVVQKIPKHITPEYFDDTVLPIVDMIFSDHLKISTMLKFMFDTGVRRSEIPLLKRKDFDLEKRTVKIRNKKSKNERIVPFSKCTKESLDQYFTLFNEKRNAFDIELENLSTVFRRLKTNFHDINFTPHLLRHSCAISCLKAGMDVTYVQRLLGHNDIKTTMIYLKVSDEMLQDTYNEKIDQHRWTN